MADDQNIKAFLSCSSREEDKPFVENVINLAQSKGFLLEGQ